MSQVWRRNWPRIAPFSNYPPDIRRAIYTTNSVESLNRWLRKIPKIRGGFPNEEAALKLLFLVLRQAAKEVADARSPLARSSEPPRDSVASDGMPALESVDCLIAATAVAKNVPVSTFDQDFRKFVDVRAEGK